MATYLRDTKNFKTSEFKCRCCGKLPDTKAIADHIGRLQKIRDFCNRMMKVNSGYRCEKNNAAQGGVKGSQHLQGMPVTLPTWAPEGYAQKNIVADKEAKMVSAWFQFGDREFSIQVYPINDVPLEGDEIYIVDNVKHYLTVDAQNHYTAVWRNTDMQIEIQGDLTEGDIKDMIYSMYKEV